MKYKIFEADVIPTWKGKSGEINKRFAKAFAQIYAREGMDGLDELQADAPIGSATAIHLQSYLALEKAALKILEDSKFHYGNF